MYQTVRAGGLNTAGVTARIIAMKDADKPFAQTILCSETPKMRSGGCLCGAVIFTVSGVPINVRVCHCQDCQRLTGSAFFVRALYSRNVVNFTGELAEFLSSTDLIRRFCPRCGSQIFAERKSRPDAIAISLGSFDKLDGICPSEHIWGSDKQEWLSLPADIKQHLEAPQ
jgi:hypothetical protein